MKITVPYMYICYKIAILHLKKKKKEFNVYKLYTTEKKIFLLVF